LPSNANINNSTGTFSFSKDSIGLYAFCIKIYEWKKNSSGNYNIIGTSKVDFVIDITTTIGINEVAFENLNVVIFPNPFKNKILVENSNYLSSKISLVNTLGQILRDFHNLSVKSEIDLSFLPSGIYYLKVQNNSKQKIFKIIKE
jgi:hypothetical protein